MVEEGREGRREERDGKEGGRHMYMSLVQAFRIRTVKRCYARQAPFQ